MRLDYQISAGAVAIAFDAIPPESVRTALKAQGYRFDGKAWQKRGVSGSAELVRWIRAELEKANAAASSAPAPIAPPQSPPVSPAIAPKSPAVAPVAPPADQSQSIAGLNSTFKARLRCPKEYVAIDAARNMACSYGFCPLDGLYYVGDPAELARGPIVDIKRPADPPAKLSSDPRPTLAAVVGAAIQSQPAPAQAEQAPPLPASQPTPEVGRPPRCNFLKQLDMFNAPATDLASFAPSRPDLGINPTSELMAMTMEAKELAAERKTLVYITRDLDSGHWHLRTADSERNAHENLMRVVFPNGRFSD